MLDIIELELIDYVKEALRKGYSDKDIINLLKEHNIEDYIIKKVMKEAKEDLDSKSIYERISPIMIITSSLIIMVCVYIIKAMSEGSELSPFLTLLNGFWPLIFPLSANLINYYYFRKSFFKGMIITFSALLFLIFLLVLLLQLGF